ncbi:portal protein [Vibrio phage 1.084.O._10N.261.49.F5]|nr:portal protein [Vibrio phage 1.084.O._10N.261.49.F5]
MAEAKPSPKKSNSTPKPPSNSTKEQRVSKRKISTAGLQYLKREVERLKPNELSSGNRLFTYELMLLDPDVSTPFGKTREMVEEAFSSYEVEYKKSSEASKKARDFLIYNIEGHFNRTTSLRGVASHAYSYAKTRLSVFEKEFTKIKTGDWKDFWGLEALAPIDLRTLDLLNPFKIDGEGRRLEYARQTPNAFVNNLFNTAIKIPDAMDGTIHINARKLALFTDSSDMVNPFGTSIFDTVYSEWRFKTLVKEILLTGVAKDLSGTPIFYVPQWILEEAEEDPDGWQANYIRDLDEQAANLHTGDQSFIRLVSDPHQDSSSLREFEVKFLGVEGGGKAFDLVAILEQSKKAIYNAFGAQNLLTGENGGGSYNLIEGQNSNHAFTVKRNVSIIEEVWNKDIIPQLFRFNEWELSPEDMPKLKAGGFEVSLDEFSKAVQRVGTAGYLPVVPEVINHIMSTMDIPYRVDDDMSTEELRKLLSENTSNAGEGNGTSGTGNTQSGKGDGVENTG